VLEEFRKFILRGNMVDMAVGIIIGAAFTAVVTSLVDDIIMPVIGLFLRGDDLSEWYINLGPEEYASLADAQEAGAATLNIGLFLNSILSLIIVGFVVFLMVKGINRLHEMMEKGDEPPPPQTTKMCPECLSEIPIDATRCAHCTIPLSAAETPADA
jgi:large conductance mechanosensitive channel